jgi:hypothetical protein
VMRDYFQTDIENQPGRRCSSLHCKGNSGELRSGRPNRDFLNQDVTVLGPSPMHSVGWNDQYVAHVVALYFS